MLTAVRVRIPWPVWSTRTDGLYCKLEKPPDGSSVLGSNTSTSVLAVSTPRGLQLPGPWPCFLPRTQTRTNVLILADFVATCFRSSRQLQESGKRKQVRESSDATWKFQLSKVPIHRFYFSPKRHESWKKQLFATVNEDLRCRCSFRFRRRNLGDLAVSLIAKCCRHSPDSLGRCSAQELAIRLSSRSQWSMAPAHWKATSAWLHASAACTCAVLRSHVRICRML